MTTFSRAQTRGKQCLALAAIFCCASHAALRPAAAFADDKAAPTRPRRVESAKADYKADDLIIRVGLMTDVTAVSLSSAQGLLVRGAASSDRDDDKIASGQLRVSLRQPASRDARAAAPPAVKSQPRYKEVPARSNERMQAAAGPQVVAFEADKMVTASDSSLVIAPALTAGAEGMRPTATVRVGGIEYRGEIHLVLNQRGRINVVNAVMMEDYLRGVIPKEISPTGFPEIEALKAQAVAARSYALSHRGRFGGEGFDLRDDARSQVYGGMSAEHPLTDRAVRETRGLVAVYPGEDGTLRPIEALYTANCGGRTEDNEAVFLTRPVAYLRSVECAPDRDVLEAREIRSGRSAEPLAGPDGRPAGRDVALLDVLGFSMPRRVTSSYLRAAVEPGEVEGWAARAARISGRPAPAVTREDVTRLPAFASLIASAIYGERRASALLSPVDVDYILAGLGGEDIPRETRADLAFLIKDGIIRLPADGRISSRAPLARAYVIETLARALALKTHTALPAEKNRLVIAPARRAGKGDAAATFEVDKSAWLFRKLGRESYAVDRLTIVGGERVTYHLNREGRVDFLEAEIAERGASSDRYGSVASWREVVSVEELGRRLARSRVRVGGLEQLVPMAYGRSNRVLEMEVVGSEGRARLRGSQIRNALGLRENLFVIERERDEDGRPAAFVFTGRGWGHGVGMCQTGAYGLAREGYSHTAIIQKYYQGVRLKKIY